MRIISGTHKGKKLASFSGREIRPTSDRMREALFSIISSRLGSLQGAKVLDLFAGTGALAIEALSRGAGLAVLVDQNPQGIRLARQNLKACALEERARVRQGDVLRTLGDLSADEPFDVVFLDPPYGRGMALPTLERIAASGLLRPDGLVCVETAREEVLPDAVGPLFRQLERGYGAASLHLYALSPKESD